VIVSAVVPASFVIRVTVNLNVGVSLSINVAVSLSIDVSRGPERRPEYERRP
jgi:hypothetical protein